MLTVKRPRRRAAEILRQWRDADSRHAHDALDQEIRRAADRVKYFGVSNSRRRPGRAS